MMVIEKNWWMLGNGKNRKRKIKEKVELSEMGLV